MKEMEKKQTQQKQKSGEKQPKTRAQKIVSIVVNVILVVALVFAALCTYVSYTSSSGSKAPSIFGISFMSIQTDSMYPTLKPGDLVVDKVVKDCSELRPGDVITYWTIINGERVLNTHRIAQVYDGGEYLIFETKGDNNPSADPLTVHESEIVGKYLFRIGGVGTAMDYLQTSTGFLVVIVIPVFLFFLWHLIQFFRVLFEYQNVKNRLRYEEERGRTEDIMEEREKQQADARAELEAQIREQLKAELLASMKQQQSAPAEETPAEKAPVEETPAQEQPAEENQEA